MTVAQIVEPDHRQPGVSDVALEVLRETVRVYGCSGRETEDESFILVTRTEEKTLLELGASVNPDRCDRHRIQRHYPPTLGSLRTPACDRASTLDPLLRHGQLTDLEVQILPAEPDDLTTAEPLVAATLHTA
jgi:hypothetical protein